MVLDRFVSYFTSVMRQNTIYFAKFVLCELLNVVVLAFNFYITNAFFSNKWGRYGFKGSSDSSSMALSKSNLDLQGDHGGLRLDFVEFDSRIPPNCRLLCLYHLCPRKQKWHKEEQTDQSQQNMVSNQHGHPVPKI